MKNSLVLPALLVGQLAASGAWAQGSGKNVTVLRMSGPQLGVRLEEVDGDVVSRLKLREEKGALVVEVMENSAAEKAGIKKDDVIVRFQGESVLTASQLGRLVREVPSGRKVDIDVIRAGAPLKLTATLQKGEWSREGVNMPDLADKMSQLGDLKFRTERDGGPRTFDFRMRPGDPGFSGMFTGPGRGRLGITYTEIEGQLASYFKAPNESAILINSVVEGSAAEKAGLKAGDLLTRLGSSSILNAEDLRDAVRDLEDEKPTRLSVWREGHNVDLTVTVEAPRKAKNDGNRWRKPVS